MEQPRCDNGTKTFVGHSKPPCPNQSLWVLWRTPCSSPCSSQYILQLAHHTSFVVTTATSYGAGRTSRVAARLFQTVQFHFLSVLACTCGPMRSRASVATPNHLTDSHPRALGSKAWAPIAYTETDGFKPCKLSEVHIAIRTEGVERWTPRSKHGKNVSMCILAWRRNLERALGRVTLGFTNKSRTLLDAL